MALPFGKLAILVGAGLVGTALAKEGGSSNVSDFLSGAFKIVLKQLKHDNSTTSNSKPINDSLLQQVSSLRQELQILASNRSVTIVTSTGSASGKYGVVIVVVVVGYGYVWWKGWKLSDMMFATRRSLSDACASVSKQLENVYSTISATKRHLSSKIDQVDLKIDECADNTAGTRQEVTELRGELKLIGSDVQSVHHVVRNLESKISRIEGRQNETNFGVGKLVAFVRNLENGHPVEQIEGAATSSRPVLELPVSPSRAMSLPSNSSSELPSPTSPNGSRKHVLQSAVTASGLKELHGISDVTRESSNNTPRAFNGVQASGEVHNQNCNSGRLERKYSGISASFLTRSRSAMQYFK